MPNNTSHLSIRPAAVTMKYFNYLYNIYLSSIPCIGYMILPYTYMLVHRNTVVHFFFYLLYRQNNTYHSGRTIEIASRLNFKIIYIIFKLLNYIDIKEIHFSHNVEWSYYAYKQDNTFR